MFEGSSSTGYNQEQEGVRIEMNLLADEYEVLYQQMLGYVV